MYGGDEDDELLESEVVDSKTATSSAPRPSKKRKVSATPAPDDPNETEESRLERKRRQNTQAARRSRIRKAEEVQKLTTQITQLSSALSSTTNELEDTRREKEVLKRDVESLKREVGEQHELSSMLKNAILDMEGVDAGRAEEIVRRVMGRWGSLCRAEQEKGLKEEMDESV